MDRRLLVAVVIVAVVVAGLGAQSGTNGGALLTRYLHGERTFALPAAFDRKLFLASIIDALDIGLPGPPEAARRATAAFALEASAARLDAGDIPGARTLLEWACGRIRTHVATDEFDIAWHAAALSIAEGFLDPEALESHVQHARGQLPGDPRLTLAWAVAAEQRTSPLLIPHLPPNVEPTMLASSQAQLNATVGRLMDDATERFALAAVHPLTAGDARVRTARMQLARDRPQDALTTLATFEASTREGWLVYLARLFRGQALEQLQRPDDALTSFRDALKVGPGGQTATMSLSSLLYRRGQHKDAETLVQLLLAETDPISDPWWTYWAGSARLWTSRLAAMRDQLQ